jgi:hypothetical protein
MRRILLNPSELALLAEAFGLTHIPERFIWEVTVTIHSSGLVDIVTKEHANCENLNFKHLAEYMRGTRTAVMSSDSVSARL